MGLVSWCSVCDYGAAFCNGVAFGLFPDYPGRDGGLSNGAQPDSDCVRFRSRPAISRFPRRYLQHSLGGCLWIRLPEYSQPGSETFGTEASRSKLWRIDGSAGRDSLSRPVGMGDADALPRLSDQAQAVAS